MFQCLKFLMNKYKRLMVEPLRNFSIAFKMEKLKIKFILMVENATEVRMKLRSKLNFSPIRLRFFFKMRINFGEQ